MFGTTFVVTAVERVGLARNWGLKGYFPIKSCPLLISEQTSIVFMSKCSLVFSILHIESRFIDF